MSQNNSTILCVGPMSINTISSVNIFSKKRKKIITLICSRNQIEAEKLGSGYVNNFSSKSFCKYINKLNNKYLKIGRDHGGPFNLSKNHTV